MATEARCLTIDTDDLAATLRYIVQSVEGWTPERLDALAEDIDPLIANGSAIDMDTSGKHATVYVSASAALLDVLAGHGLEGV